VSHVHSGNSSLSLVLVNKCLVAQDKIGLLVHNFWGVGYLVFEVLNSVFEDFFNETSLNIHFFISIFLAMLVKLLLLLLVAELIRFKSLEKHLLRLLLVCLQKLNWISSPIWCSFFECLLTFIQYKFFYTSDPFSDNSITFFISISDIKSRSWLVLRSTGFLRVLFLLRPNILFSKHASLSLVKFGAWRFISISFVVHKVREMFICRTFLSCIVWNQH
jgi:hypothetical protein